MKVLVLLCVFVAALAAPPSPVRTDEEIRQFRAVLEKAKPDPNGKLEDNMAKFPNANAWENSGKYQGDILLTDQQIQDMTDEFSGKTPNRNGLINPSNRWPNNHIPYEFQTGHMTDAQREQVIRAFQDIESHSCVTFVPRSGQSEYVRITNWSDGCYAHVGHYGNFGAHTLNLANGCFNHFIIIHEWLHVVGFMHMHQTFNRDSFIWINWQNVGGGMESQFTTFNSNQVSMLGLPYEYASNQHYDRFAFSFNGQPTIIARQDDNGLMGQLRYVTEFDWLRVRRLYNCPGGWTEPVDLDDANKPAREAPLVQETVLPAVPELIIHEEELN